MLCWVKDCNSTMRIELKIHEYEDGYSSLFKSRIARVIELLDV